MTAERVARIEHLLRQEFAPTMLLVRDKSHLHVGHAGAQDGKGHFDVKIVSTKFDGKNRLARHRMIYAALGQLMESDIHALHINALSPAEV